MQYELFFSVTAALTVIAVIFTEMKCRRADLGAIDSLKATDSFLADVRHMYFRYGSVTGAVAVTVGSLSPDMRRRFAPVAEYLNSSSSSADKGADGIPFENRYMRLFTAISSAVDEQGDIVENGSSVYAEALTAMRLEIGEELRSIEKRRHKCRGLALTAGLPILAVPVISEWCAGIIPSLKPFYFSRVGALLRLAILAVTAVCYCAVVFIRDDTDVFERISYLERRGIRKGPVPVIADLVMRHKKKDGGKPGEFLRRLNAPHLLGSWYVFRIALTLTAFAVTFAVSRVGYIESQYVAAAEAEDASPAQTVGDDREGGEDVLLDLLAAGIAATVSYFSAYAALAALAGKADRMLRRESDACRMLVRMQYRVPGTDVVTLLKSMEAFTVILRPYIQRCLSEYSISDTGALEALYVAVEDRGFRRLVTCFLTATDEGMETSFGEITADMTDGRELARHEDMIGIDNMGLLAGIAAVIPGGLILIGYLILPFVISASLTFTEYSSSLTGLIGGT